MINGIYINDHNSTIDITLNKLTESELLIPNSVPSPFKNILFYQNCLKKRKNQRKKFQQLSQLMNDYNII